MSNAGLGVAGSGRVYCAGVPSVGFNPLSISRTAVIDRFADRSRATPAHGTLNMPNQTGGLAAN